MPFSGNAEAWASLPWKATLQVTDGERQRINHVSG